PSPGPPTDGLPLPRRYWAIAAILLAIAMSVLDSTIVNIALPSIARDFGATSAASIWVVNAYQLAILVVLLPLSSLGEVVGHRRRPRSHLRFGGAGRGAVALAVRHQRAAGRDHHPDRDPGASGDRAHTAPAEPCGRGALRRHVWPAAERAAVPRASRRNGARA